MKCLNTPGQPASEEAAGSQDDIRVEAAQVTTLWCVVAAAYVSPTYTHPGVICSPEAFCELLHANAHQAFLYTIALFAGPSEPSPNIAALASAFRAIAAACAEPMGS